MTLKTYAGRPTDVQRVWHVLDANDRPLGRLATQIATLLRGKHKPTFSPSLDTGDYVIVINAATIAVTGNKLDDKIYYRHSGYPGGLTETPYMRMMERHPERIVQAAVKGMIPHNRLGRKILRHLKVYAGPEHPHEAQVNADKGKEEPQPEKAEAEKAEATA